MSFFSVPCSIGRTVTPIGVKSLTHMFFQAKNSRLFRYDVNKSGAFCSVSIGGKTVASHLFILPFCTQTAEYDHVLPWADVALELNLNVDLTEIVITPENEAGCAYDTDDYSVVFVTSDKECDESKGFDYFETKQLTLKSSLDIDVTKLVKETYDAALIVAREAYVKAKAEEGVTVDVNSDEVREAFPDLQYNIDKVQMPLRRAYVDAKNAAGEKNYDGEEYSVYDDEVMGEYPGESYSLPIVFTYNGVTYDSVANGYGEVWESDAFRWEENWDVEHSYGNNSTNRSVMDNINDYWTKLSMKYFSGSTATEFSLSTDHVPTMMFAARYCAKKKMLQPDGFTPFYLSIGGTAEEIIPKETISDIFTATARTPFRKALMQIPETAGATKNMTYKLRPVQYPVKTSTDNKGNEVRTADTKNEDTDYWYFFLFLGYKKLA